jgi:transposase
VDKSGILKVCVDDFAFKKRYSEGILIDIETHRIIDLLDSREKEPVAKWLKKYPNLQLVSRDGSHIYSAVIHEAHPNAIQVSDRFHLLKNLSEAVEKYMLRLFPARLEIPATKFTQNPEMQALLDTRNRYERIMFVRKKKSEGLTALEIALLMHASLSTITKYLQMKKEDIPPIKSSLRKREHKTAIGKKCKKILYVRNLSKQGKSIEEIVRITGHTRQTVRNYLSDGCSIINGHYDNKHQ